MNPEDLPLRDIHLPESISAWPLGPGWWLLIVALTLLVFAVTVRWFWQRTALRRAAIAELKLLESSLARTRDEHAFLCGVSTLLRRVAIARFGRNAAASAEGETWLALLSTPSLQLSTQSQSLLTEAPYRKSADSDPRALREVNRFAHQFIQAGL